MCADDTSTSTVSLDALALPFVAFGDTDAGGEGNCGPPGEAVAVTLADGPLLTATSRYTVTLLLPIATGSRTVTIFSDVDLTTFEATLDLTMITPRPGSQLPSVLEGDLDSANANRDLHGHFRATHCALLDVICI